LSAGEASVNIVAGHGGSAYGIVDASAAAMNFIVAADALFGRVVEVVALKAGVA
jgi:hypothetical protein